MKLIVNNETFQAEKIVKSDLNIIGYDINDNEIFSFKGISNFTGFILHDDLDNVIEFETPQATDSERITATEEAINVLMTISMM